MWEPVVWLAVSDSLPAVLAGNAVVVKPDVQTTHTALAALELLLELPPEALAALLFWVHAVKLEIASKTPATPAAR